MAASMQMHTHAVTLSATVWPYLELGIDALEHGGVLQHVWHNDETNAAAEQTQGMGMPDQHAQKQEQSSKMQGIQRRVDTKGTECVDQKRALLRWAVLMQLSCVQTA